MIIKEILTPDFPITWLPWAVQYFFLLGLAYGAVFIGVISVFTSNTISNRIQTLAGLLMVTAGIVAPIALLADLHQPFRAWHFYAQLRTTSWMWVGAFALPIFDACAVLFGYLLIRPHLMNQGHDGFGRFARWLALGKWSSASIIKPVAIAALISASFVTLYSGMEIIAVKARLLWNTPLLPLFLACSAIFSAISMIIVLNIVLKGHCQQTQKVLLQRLRETVALFVILIVVWVLFGGKSFSEAQRIFTFSPTWKLAAYWVAGSVGLLCSLLITNLRFSRWLTVFASFIAIHLAWGLRWLILMETQTVPKYGAGTYVYNISWGTEGVLGIVGTFGLWFALIIILSELIRHHSTAGAV